jgi:vacuolar-type H+-ATPase subunit F/Vma7
MSPPVYIGDETSATGYRFAGLETIICGAGEAHARFLQALSSDAPLILLSQTLVHVIGVPHLTDAMARGAPPVTIVPDIASLEGYTGHRDSVLQRLGLGQEAGNG